MGTFRLYLALAVLFFHFQIKSSDGFFFNLNSLLVSSSVAIYSFFLLSGFYISLGLNSRYIGPKSNMAFYAGRVLRLWPTYLVSLLLLAISGVLQQGIKTVLSFPLPMAILAVFSNLTMIGADLLLHISAIGGKVVFSEYGIDPNHNGGGLIFNFPAWTLAIELLFYMVAPFVVRSFRRSVIFLCVGLGYCAYLKYFGAGLGSHFRVELYYPYFMAYFGMGIIGYHLFKEAKDARLPRGLWKYVAIFSAASLAGLYGFPWVYIALAIVVGPFFSLTKNNSIDTFLGELSYPVYILHIPVASIIRQFGQKDPGPLSVFLGTMVASIGVVMLVERPIERYRARRRQRASGEVRSIQAS